MSWDAGLALPVLPRTQQVTGVESVNLTTHHVALETAAHVVDGVRVAVEGLPRQAANGRKRGKVKVVSDTGATVPLQAEPVLRTQRCKRNRLPKKKQRKS